jgi:hypothetical protein
MTTIMATVKSCTTITIDMDRAWSLGMMARGSVLAAECCPLDPHTKPLGEKKPALWRVPTSKQYCA